MILLVEDEAQVRAVIRRLLTEQGYKVLTAVNGVEALHTLAEHPGVRAILTDVVMPVMGGHEFANIAREQYPGIPLVFMSGYSGSEQERRGTVVGADHALAKPFDPQQLFDMLAKVLAPR